VDTQDRAGSFSDGLDAFRHSELKKFVLQKFLQGFTLGKAIDPLTSSYDVGQ
jgi:hypothetical protein